MEKNTAKIIQSVVSVVQRMIINHLETTEPKKWDIKLGIDGLDVMEMSVVYLGDDEWRLDFIDDQSGQSDGSDALELRSIFEKVERVLPELEVALIESRPALRLSATIVKRGNALPLPGE